LIFQILHGIQGLAIDVTRLSLWLILLIAIFAPIERLCAVHPSKFWRKQMGVDIGWYFINSLVPAALLTPPLVLAAHALHNLNPGGYYTAIGTWPLWVKVPVMIFLGDVATYWGHRALHGIPLLWRFHAIHHSAEDMDWLSNTRAHPVDMVLVRLCGLAPAYLLGLAQTTGKGIDPGVALVMIIGTLWTFFIHANIRMRLGPVEWLISSPIFHHWHHSIDERRETNYAFFFPFIDWLFGTAYLPKAWPPGYGINPPPPATLAGQFFEPLDPVAGGTGYMPRPWKKRKPAKPTV